MPSGLIDQACQGIEGACPFHLKKGLKRKKYGSGTCQNGG